MVRFITTPDGLAGDALFAARGAHEVLLEEADGGTAMRVALPFLTWSEVENLPALPLGEWLALVGAPTKALAGVLKGACPHALWSPGGCMHVMQDSPFHLPLLPTHRGWNGNYTRGCGTHYGV